TVTANTTPLPAPSTPWLPFPQPLPHHYATATPSPTSPSPATNKETDYVAFGLDKIDLGCLVAVGQLEDAVGLAE
nr:hypothetical protein [Tanacetum cinerariifolium]